MPKLKFKSYPQLKRDLDKVFSLFIRARDSVEGKKMKKEKKYKLNIIMPEEWWESDKTFLGTLFYPARYHYPKPFHYSYVMPIRRNYDNDNLEFITPAN